MRTNEVPDSRPKESQLYWWCLVAQVATLTDYLGPNIQGVRVHMVHPAQRSLAALDSTSVDSSGAVEGVAQCPRNQLSEAPICLGRVGIARGFQLHIEV